MDKRNVGGRPKKVSISLSDPSSLQKVMQNIWNEADEQRIKAVFQYNKQNRNVKDNDEIAMVGKTNTELLKVVDGAIDKKLQVARLMQQVIYKDAPGLNAISNGNNNTSGSALLTDEDKDSIFDLIQQQAEKEAEKQDINALKEKNKDITKEVKDDHLPF